MKSGDEVFGKFSVLSSLAPADRQALSAYLEESTYEPGQRVYAEGEAVGSMFLLQSGVVDLVAAGTVTAEEAYSHSVDKESLVAQLRAAGHAL